MTPGELQRALKAKAKERETRLKERAVMDYALAKNIGHCVATHLYGGRLKAVEDAYPWLFQDEETEERKAKAKAEAWAAKFRAFADAHNSKIKEVQQDEERTA